MKVVGTSEGRTVFVLSRDEILALKNDRPIGGKVVSGAGAMEFVIMRDRAYEREMKSFQRTVQKAALQAASQKASEDSELAEAQPESESTPST